MIVCIVLCVVSVVPEPVPVGRFFLFKHFKCFEEAMADLWLISVPLDKTSITSVEKLKHIIAKTNLASCFMFPIPDLKVSFVVPNGP